MKAVLAIASDTLSGLLRPRRAAAIAAVVLPMLYAQAAWNIDAIRGVEAGLLLSGGTLLLAPAAWRVLAPRGPVGLAAYGLLGAVSVVLLAGVLPRWGGFEDRFLSQPISFPFLLGLFGVGGYGLGQDIEAERRLAAETARAAELARDKERAELLALRAQLDPHFLFNTLNAIAEWCVQDPVQAEQAILRLSGVLRTLQGAVRRPLWPLAEELDLCRAVLDLHRVRDPGRYTSQLRGDAPDIQVPPMILLPLVENAIKHGPAAGNPGEVLVTVATQGDGVRVEVDNPGTYAGPRVGGEGLGLVRRRLALSYGERARLEIAGESGRTRATLLLPRIEAERP